MSNPTDVAAQMSEPAAALSETPAAASETPVVATPSADPAGAAPPAAASAPIEPPKIVVAPAAAPIIPAQEAPQLPRAATLPTKPEAPVIPPAAVAPSSPPATSTPSTGTSAWRGGRFALLAACVAVAASLGAIGGSLGVSGLHQETPVAAPAVRHEATDDVRALKETVVQLRANVRTLNESIAALRTSLNTSSSAANTQLAKITETLDRVERGQERRVATLPPAPEPTGSITQAGSANDQKAAAKLPVLDDWIVRKVYDGTALVEGRRYGIIEIGAGDMLPGLGRVQEIKRQDGHWVVVTPKGLILPRR
jgi:hypothetical protein